MSAILPNHLFGSPGLITAENHVKGLIQAAEANIERLTAQIKELVLIRQREQSILATLRLMVVPIGKLPMELLVEIFSIAVSESASLHTVFRLSQVSPYWRQIVHQTPQLWAEIVVRIQLGRELPEPYLSGLKTLLTRSTPYPISVSLAQTPKSFKKSLLLERWKHLAAIITPTASRWKDLHISLDSFLHFDDLPSGTFEALESLEIGGFRGQTSPIMVFQSSPRLKSFALDTAASKIRLIHLPWSQLTHLNITDNSIGACRLVLLQCNNLISARFNTSFDWDFAPEQVESPIVVLPFLKTLALTFHVSEFGRVNGLDAFLMPLSLPSLTRIDFEFDPMDARWASDTLSAFQGRAPQIEHISLTYSSIDEGGLIALLRNAPSLTSLDIECCWSCVDVGFFDTFRYHEDDLTPIVPKLEEISFFGIGELDEVRLEEAIRSRWWDGERVLLDGSPPRVSRLKIVSIACSDTDQMNDDLKARMQDLEAQGLVLDLY